MNEYILILGLFTGDTVATTAILFPSKEACEEARKQAVQEFTVREWWGASTRVRALCAPRYVP